MLTGAEGFTVKVVKIRAFFYIRQPDIVDGASIRYISDIWGMLDA